MCDVLSDCKWVMGLLGLKGRTFKLGKGEVEGAEKLRLAAAITLLGKNSEQKGGCSGNLKSKMRSGIPWKLPLLSLALNKEIQCG